MDFYNDFGSVVHRNDERKDLVDELGVSCYVDDHLLNTRMVALGSQAFVDELSFPYREIRLVCLKFHIVPNYPHILT